MTGKVCDKHQEWCPTGECRWCEPEVIDMPPDQLLGLLAFLPPPPVNIIVHFPGCAQAPCSCPAIATSHAVQQHKTLNSAAAYHGLHCPLIGLVGDPAQALAAGCTCIPLP